MFGRFGWAEILVVVILVLILFSHNKIPTMMKNLADGLKVFKKELKNTPAEKGTEKSGGVTVAKSSAKKSAAQKSTAKTVKKNAASDKKITYVEFGAYSSIGAANQARRTLMSAQADLFDGVELFVLEQGAKSPFKLRAAFDSAVSAREFVKGAQAANVKCAVVA